MVTAKQTQMVQMARRHWTVSLNDQAYRVLLHNVAGVESTTELTNVSVEDVLSVLDGMRYVDDYRGGGYWTGVVANRGARANARLVWMVRELAGQVNRYPLEATCRWNSEERTGMPEQLTPREAWNLIEALKTIRAKS